MYNIFVCGRLVDKNLSRDTAQWFAKELRSIHGDSNVETSYSMTKESLILAKFCHDSLLIGGIRSQMTSLEQRGWFPEWIEYRISKNPSEDVKYMRFGHPDFPGIRVIWKEDQNHAVITLRS